MEKPLKGRLISKPVRLKSIRKVHWVREYAGEEGYGPGVDPQCECAGVETIPIACHEKMDIREFGVRFGREENLERGLWI